MRTLFRFDSYRRSFAASGFVLPTASLVTVVIVLFVGAIVFQTYDRTVQVTGSREKLRVDNLAGPAVERAKAKIEFMFKRDTRFPTGVPSERFLLAMMNNTDRTDDGCVDVDLDGDAGNCDLQVLTNPDVDEYTIPGETRLDLDGDGAPDNAWSFDVDLDGDGEVETVAYSIIFQSEADTDGDGDADVDYRDNSLAQKAGALVTRTGPISAQGSGGGGLGACDIPGLRPQQGWLALDSASVRKNFQVNVFVESGNAANRTVTAYEFQQDRQLDLGNKFGVWFRYDLLIHPGPQFNLNGAIHTDGSMVTWNDSLRFYLVSSPDSCIYTEDANIISLSQVENLAGDLLYQGQVISIRNQTEEVDLFPPDGSAPTNANGFEKRPLSVGTDSVAESLTPSNVDTAVASYLLDPIRLFTEDELRSRGQQTGELVNTGRVDGEGNAIEERAYNPQARDPEYGRNPAPDVSDRIFNDVELRPFVDDTYRADDRWGPKPSYGRSGQTRIPTVTDGDGATTNLNGELIREDDITGALSIDALVSLAPPSEFPEDVGLDGYWERRAFAEGSRIIVGQRLELGNPFGWLFDANGDGDYDDPRDRGYGDDPLNPPDDDDLATSGTNEAFSPPADWPDNLAKRPNEFRQMRTLRDNLAAVQAGAVYHSRYDINGDGTLDSNFPVACVALTAHPGTLVTKNNSTTFDTVTFGGNSYVDVDFLTGQGTNGWEFFPPGNIQDPDRFDELVSSNTPLRRALGNLAKFAGDPDGAFPPLQEEMSPTAMVHPYPQMTMWGDFSNLRRALATVDAAGSLDAVNIADQTTIHTASCLLGMLAYNLNVAQDEFDTLLNSGNSLQSVGVNLSKLFAQGSGNSCNGANPSVIDSSLYSSTGNGGGGSSGCLFGPGAVIDSDTWVDPNPNSVLPGCDGQNSNPTDGPGFTPFCDEPEVFAEFTVEQLLDQAGITGADRDALNAASIVFERASQIERDRVLGFSNGLAPMPVPNGAAAVGWYYDDAAGAFDAPGYTEPAQVQANENIVIRSSCDPDIFDNVVGGSSSGSNGSSSRSRLGLALVLCRGFEASTPKYPSLFYLFPKADHRHDGSLVGAAMSNGGIEALQPASEPYISDVNISTYNDGEVYIVPDDVTGSKRNNDVEDGNEDSLKEIALQPRFPGRSCDPGNGGDGWCLPYRTTGTTNNSDLSPSALNPITYDGTTYYLPFQDKGMMNGRQLMAIRALNIDLDLLRDNYAGNSDPDTTVNETVNADGDSWIPNGAIIYAFREDAIREDGIARPRATSYENCNTEVTLLTTRDCRMDPRNKVDPPVNEETGVSLKPVDYIADPDRRPHGFRLANGDFLGRMNTTEGLTFISDNPVYFLGDFNIHSREEFDTTQSGQSLNLDNYNNFYSRNILDTGFSDAFDDNPESAASDRWRVSEVLSDAITFLSNSYCDGTIEAGLRKKNNNSIDGETCDDHSFRNATYIGRGDVVFFLENGETTTLNADGSIAQTTPSAVPISVDRNGIIQYVDPGSDDTLPEVLDDVQRAVDPVDASDAAILKSLGQEGDDFRKISSNRDLNNAVDTEVDSVVVSGLSPTRINESYGGLHNFPRFNETWSGDNLVIRGSLIQLNFSVYDTANLDQQETFDFPETLSVAGKSGSSFKFYSPPNRRWGYDPALQYVAPAPIVERLLTSANPRSEILARIEISDPYIQLLCRSVNPNPTSCTN